MFEGNDIERYQELVNQSAHSFKSNANKIAQEKLQDQLESMSITAETIPIGSEFLMGVGKNVLGKVKGLTKGDVQKGIQGVVQGGKDFVKGFKKGAGLDNTGPLLDTEEIAPGVFRAKTTATPSGPVDPRTSLREGGSDGIHLEPTEAMDGVEAEAGAEAVSGVEAGLDAVDTGLAAADAVDAAIPGLSELTDVATAVAGIATVATGIIEGIQKRNAPTEALKTVMEGYSEQFGR